MTVVSERILLGNGEVAQDVLAALPVRRIVAGRIARVVSDRRARRWASRSPAGSGSCRSGPATAPRDPPPARVGARSTCRVLVRGGHVHAVVLADAHARSGTSCRRRSAPPAGVSAVRLFYIRAVRLVGRVVVFLRSPSRSPWIFRYASRSSGSVVRVAPVGERLHRPDELDVLDADRGRARLVQHVRGERGPAAARVVGHEVQRHVHQQASWSRCRAPARKCRRAPAPRGRPSGRCRGR